MEVVHQNLILNSDDVLQKRQNSALDIVKVKDEPVDLGLQHGLDEIFQPPDTISTGRSTTVKDEDEIIELAPCRPASDSLVPIPEHPRKRQRLIMDSVLVPTLAEIQRKKGAGDDDLKKLQKLFKPKKKKGELTLDNEILMSRLKPIGLDTFAVNLPRAELNQMVSRLFMSSIYGGSMQATFPKIGAKKLAEHGMNDFMYLHLKYHPYAPQCPGGGGLWFDPEWYGVPWEGVHRVFTRDRNLSMWQYMGQYEVKSTASLTLAEWLGLKTVRYNWAKGICDMDWGNCVRARIQTRKEVGPDREPTEEEVMAVLDSERWKSTTPEDVMIAFDCGKEKMGVWTMKCIGYDHRFQVALYDQYPNWTPPESSKSKKKGKRSEVKEEVKVEMKSEEVKVEDGIFLPAKAPREKKRKRPVTRDSEPSEFGTEVWTKDEAKVKKVGDEEKAFINIRTRGTKSRPPILL